MACQIGEQCYICQWLGDVAIGGDGERLNQRAIGEWGAAQFIP